MALTLDLDPSSLKQILEPGFRFRLAGKALGDSGQVGDPTLTDAIWRDPVTGTLMLYPQQLRGDWLNSPDQVASIIRATDYVIGPTDTTNRTVFEEFAFGNSSNYYIYHSPTPFPGFPTAPVPGAGPALVGSGYGGSLDTGLNSISLDTEVPFNTYSAPATPVGSITSGKVIAHTREPLDSNAALYFRWFHPNPKAGHQTRYIFFVGQLALEVAGNVLVVWTDTSAAGDRSAFQRIWAKPLFGGGDFSPGSSYSFFATFDGNEGNAHDRSLLFIPYHRNRVLLGAWAGDAARGTYYSVRVKRDPVAAATGSDHSWEITRGDKLAVWCLTPAPGRFQVQHVRYVDASGGSPVPYQMPHVAIDYTPAGAATVTKASDEEHGTSITGTISQPPAYSLRYNQLDLCPEPTTATGDQTRTYGVELAFVGESTHRWTPFLYALDFTAGVVLANPGTTPLTVGSTAGGSGSYIQRAMVSLGEESGDNRGEIDLLDWSPYSLAPYYYRSELPLQLKDAGTAVLTGYTDPHEVTPLNDAGRPRQVKLRVQDRWKQMKDTYLRDQGSRTGYGHITTVLFLAEQAGVDTSTAETPPLTASYNTPLGWLNSSIPRTEEQTEQLIAAWKPQDDDTAASFVERIAETFSGWDFGFRQDGTFFYLPYNYFTTVALRFFNTHAAAVAASLPNNPIIRPEVKFETLPPEANVVLVVGAEDKEGKVLRSSPWIDWASVLNPAAPNFLGRRKAVVVVLGGIYACEELNRIAYTIFQQVRRRRRRLTFESSFVPSLKTGQLIEAGTYGNYRIRKMKAEYEHGAWAPCTFECEKDELGYQ